MKAFLMKGHYDVRPFLVRVLTRPRLINETQGMLCFVESWLLKPMAQN
jgi:hypothetical protein